MSVIGMSVEDIRVYHGMGDSWLEAIWRQRIEPKAWLGCRMHDVGQAISHAGDHLHGLCDCKD